MIDGFRANRHVWQPTADVSEMCLIVDGLRKEYTPKSGQARLALDGVSFQVAHGEVYGLLGPNGAGKSTALGAIAGVVYAGDGTIEVNGELVAPDAPARRHVGVMPQSVALYDELTVKENLEFFGTLCGLRGAALRQRIAEVLEIVGLPDRAHSEVRTLSGGMQRRISFATAIIHAPSLLLLDEPFVGVDPHSRVSLLNVVRQLRDEGTAILVTTHNLDEAEMVCDRVGILQAGSLIAQGSVADLLTSLGITRAGGDGRGGLTRAFFELTREDGLTRARDQQPATHSEAS